MSQRVYVVAGEVSGDTHGAELMAAMAGVEFHGLGGPGMRKVSGGQVCDWVDEAAVVGLWEVLKRYGWFKERFSEALAEIADCKPDLLLLIDYPGFNERLARKVRKQFPTVKIVHYVAPQVWAWNKRRLPRLAHSHDLMMCLFPFEVPIFEEVGLRAVCPGHPLVDELEEKRMDVQQEEKLIGLFPGSRRREVARLFPLMLEVAEELREQQADRRFVAAAASERMLMLMQEQVKEAGLQEVVELRVGESQQLMQQVELGMVASGTATLEAAYYGMPYCLVYQVAWLTYLVARQVVTLPHIGLINILAGRELVPEFIQGEANVYEVSQWMKEMLASPEKRAELSRDLLKTASSLGKPGVHERAAGEVMKLLSS